MTLSEASVASIAGTVEGEWTQTPGLCHTVKKTPRDHSQLFLLWWIPLAVTASTSHRALKKATPFSTSQKGRNKEVKELEILLGLGQVRHADPASDELSPLRNLMETQSKVSHQLCHCPPSWAALVRFCSGLPPHIRLRVRVALQACNTLSCCSPSPCLCQVHASGCGKALPSNPASHSYSVHSATKRVQIRQMPG